MKKFLVIVSLLILPMAPAWGEPQFYGRANVSFELVDEGGDTDTALQSNASRLGLKGSQPINDTVDVIYQLEYGVSFDDGDTFSQRNIFIGLQSDWGAVIAGHFDTPFKRAQGEVDLFNDLRGDIGDTITVHDNRQANSIMYSTPDSTSPFGANMAYIASEEEGRSDGISAAVNYEANGLYTAVAVDQDVEQEGSEAARFVSTYSHDAWQLGALIEMSNPNAGDSENGWLLSGLYTLDRWAFKAQAGQSDILEEGGKTLSIGADYRLTENAYAFTFYTTTDSDISDTHHYLGAGFELRF